MWHIKPDGGGEMEYNQGVDFISYINISHQK